MVKITLYMLQEKAVTAKFCLIEGRPHKQVQEKGLTTLDSSVCLCMY